MFKTLLGYTTLIVLSSAQLCLAQPQGKVLFHGGSSESWDISVMDADGSNVIQLTDNNGHNFYPEWSPDGTQIAFYSSRDGNREIYVMNADGSNQIRLTDRAAEDGVPSWSPDGTQIAFISGTSPESARSELFLMNADGSDLRSFPQVGQSLLWDRPSWSPDGTKVLITRVPEGPPKFNRKIYAVDVDSDQLTLLSPSPDDGSSVFDITPTYSPDGSRILFSTGSEGTSGNSTGHLMVMNADGTGRRRLNEVRGWEPHWSPDGNYITYTASTGGAENLWIMEADGSNAQRLVVDLSKGGHWLPALANQVTAIEASSWGRIKADFR